MQAQMESRRVALPIPNHGARRRWMVNATSLPLHLQEIVLVPTVKGTESAPGSFCMGIRMRKFLPPPRFEPMRVPTRSESLNQGSATF